MVDLDTKELLHINATYNPHFAWVTQQFKNAFFYHNNYPTLCICDNDSIFGSQFEKMIDSYFEIKLQRIPYNFPEKNGKTERFHRSLKSEAFANVIPLNLVHTQRVCREYRDYYNFHRPHQGISGGIPKGSRRNPSGKASFITNEHLGGKIISFDTINLAAA